MTYDEFTKQQYLTLRDEIRDSKSRIFWLMIIGIALVMIAGYLAAEHPSAFANAATPFLLIALMLSFVSEQNNIARAGRYIREVVEPINQDIPGWEHWLELKKPVREVDHCFVVGFAVLFSGFLCYYHIAYVATTRHARPRTSRLVRGAGLHSRCGTRGLRCLAALAIFGRSRYSNRTGIAAIVAHSY